MADNMFVPHRDLVKVVRCKDCEYYHMYEEGFRDCGYTIGLNYATPDDFCSYGVMRKLEEGADNG